MKKRFRIKKSEEFQSLIQQRKFVSSKAYSLYFSPRKENHARVGISASKKLGIAVVRNKIKRQVRMMVQDIWTFDENFDCIILVRAPYLKQSYVENHNELKSNYKLVKMKCKIQGEKNESFQTES